MVIQVVPRKIAVSREQIEKFKKVGLVASVNNSEVLNNALDSVNVADNNNEVISNVAVPVNNADVARAIASDSFNPEQAEEVSIFDAPPVQDLNTNLSAPSTDEAVVITDSPEAGIVDNTNNVNTFDSNIVVNNEQLANNIEVRSDSEQPVVPESQTVNDNDLEVLKKLDLLTSVLADLQETMDQVKVSIEDLKNSKKVNSVMETNTESLNKPDEQIGVQMEPNAQANNFANNFDSPNIFDQQPASFKL